VQPRCGFPLSSDVDTESALPSLQDASAQAFEEDLAAGIDDASDDWPSINSDILSCLSRPSSWAPLPSHCSASSHDVVPHDAGNFDPADLLADDHYPGVQQQPPDNMSARERSIGKVSSTQFILSYHSSYYISYWSLSTFQLIVSYSCWYSDCPGAPFYY
jgi:hypothetical protein